MRKRNTENIGDILQQFLNQNVEVKEKLAESRVIHGWNAVLGNAVASYTTNIYFRKGILYVNLSSSVLRSELIMAKEKLTTSLNEYAGMQIVDEIIFR